MKHIIDKSFSFCYGHRVHNQRLDTNFTENGNACLACRHLHGHEGLVKLFVEEIDTGVNIKSTGMVVDFKMMGWFKNFIDDTLDHKFIMDIQDPLFHSEFPLIENFSKHTTKMPEGFYIPDLTHIQNWLDSQEKLTDAQKSAIFEKYEGAIFVDFVPTSENLAGWLGTIAAEKMKSIPNIRVAAVEYWETPKSHCRVEL